MASAFALTLVPASAPASTRTLKSTPQIIDLVSSSTPTSPEQNTRSDSKARSDGKEVKQQLSAGLSAVAKPFDPWQHFALGWSPLTIIPDTKPASLPRSTHECPQTPRIHAWMKQLEEKKQMQQRDVHCCLRWCQHLLRDVRRITDRFGESQAEIAEYMTEVGSAGARAPFTQHSRKFIEMHNKWSAIHRQSKSAISAHRHVSCICRCSTELVVGCPAGESFRDLVF